MHLRWNRVSRSVMQRALLLKFSQNRYLRSALLATGDSILVEASPFDPRWGVGQYNILCISSQPFLLNHLRIFRSQMGPSAHPRYEQVEGEQLDGERTDDRSEEIG